MTHSSKRNIHGMKSCNFQPAAFGTCSNLTQQSDMLTCLRSGDKAGPPLKVLCVLINCLTEAYSQIHQHNPNRSPAFRALGGPWAVCPLVNRDLTTSRCHLGPPELYTNHFFPLDWAVNFTVLLLHCIVVHWVYWRNKCFVSIYPPACETPVPSLPAWR